MTHGAGPARGVACAAVDIWLALERVATDYNRDRERPFDRLLPALRSIATTGDGLDERVRATFAARLPLRYELEPLAGALVDVAQELCGAPAIRDGRLDGPGSTLEAVAEGERLRCALRFHGYEAAFRAPSGGPLAAAFLSAIRQVGADTAERPDPRFVVKTGTSDMNVVGPGFGCPILAYGPGDSALDHTPHEHIELDEYWRGVLVVGDALARL
jgi:LysW-gamma-L-lysine carboxypeptidase